MLKKIIECLKNRKATQLKNKKRLDYIQESVKKIELERYKNMDNKKENTRNKKYFLDSNIYGGIFITDNDETRRIGQKEVAYKKN